MVAAIVVPGAPAAAAEESTVSFDGAGWGHGVGLSQYGAFGASRDGWTAAQITSHFYKGTTLEFLGEGELSVPDDLWVGLDRDLETVTLVARTINWSESSAPLIVSRISDGMAWELADGDRVSITRINDATCELAFSGSVEETAQSTPCRLDVLWDGNQEIRTRAVEVDGCEFIDWNGRESEDPGSWLDRPCIYARGYMVIRPTERGSAGRFDMSVVMGLEDYLLGISEMPYWWGLVENDGMAALEAQAIAARSYARELQLYRDEPGSGINGCKAWCHVRDDTYDQRYIGWGHGWSTWIDAVTKTADVVMMHEDAVTSPYAANDTENIVRGYYSSSSGGATENGYEVAFGVSPREYYSSVDDHWALDPTLNFRASWTVESTPSQVAAKVGLDSLESAAVVARNTSGSARTVEFAGVKNGAATTISLGSSAVRSKFGLYSIYFDVVFGDPHPFSDISGSVHYDAIVFIADAGITTGCNPPANTKYCPAGSVTRGQMAAFLVRALGLTDDGGKDWFGDDDGSTFEADINKLATSGITFGCNDAHTNYCPSDTVTRAQMAAFLVRSFGYTDSGPGDWFNDDDASIFENDIDRLRTAGVTFGCNPPENTNYCPDDPVRRDQMASFITRALGGS
jgi:SpoIID/LytB domain protein